MRSSRWRRTVAIAASASLLLVLVACVGEADPFSGTGTGTTPTTSSSTSGTSTTTSSGGSSTTSTTSGTGTGTGTGTGSQGGAAGYGGEGGAGASGCPAPLAECDGNPTTICETNIDESTEHCGGCHSPCAADCEFGICAEPCDANIPIDEPNPSVAIRAIGLCRGVSSAAWVLADGTAAPNSASYHLGHGVLPDFTASAHVQEGSRLLALSSGTARRPGDAGYATPDAFDKTIACSHPGGFPVVSPSCPGVLAGEPHDPAAISVTITPPPRATGFSFKSRFYTYEWPEYVCTEFGDAFLALVSPAPPGAPHGNTVLDPLGNTMGAHSAFVEACACTDGPPCTAGNLSYDCPLGDADLVGTGFEGHAATGWLETRVPIAAGSTFTLRLTVYDSNDGILDSTVLVDDWHWIESPGASPVTVAVADPL